MRKLITRFLISLFFILPAIRAGAQQEDSVIVAVPDSMERMLDSISEQVAVSDSIYPQDESDTSREDETLYFSGKEDSLSLYDSSVIEWRTVPDTTILALKNDKNFLYANKDRTEKKKKQDDENDTGGWDFLSELLGSYAVRQVIFIFILVLFAVAVIWFLVKNKMNLFGRGKGTIAAPGQAVEGEPDNIFTADLQSAIENAEKKEDYRLAIRLSYLLLLKKFSEEDLIKYKDDTTNMEYLQQVYTQPFYREFFTVTRNYEYAWYGEMPVTRPVYDRVQADFTNLYTKAEQLN
ncbi:MAG: hypothetical protein KF746_03695 [Chitinophagaceae bacterium]|nr:hypothetical protein [Chitinophagaceae bacterium]